MFIRKGQTTCEYPKFIYFGIDFTFLDLKKYILKVFKFLHHYDISSLRLWKLAPVQSHSVSHPVSPTNPQINSNLPFIQFMQYYRSMLSLEGEPSQHGSNFASPNVTETSIVNLFVV